MLESEFPMLLWNSFSLAHVKFNAGLFWRMIQMEFKPMSVYYMDGKQNKTFLAFWFCFLIGIHLKYRKKKKKRKYQYVLI